MLNHHMEITHSKNTFPKSPYFYSICQSRMQNHQYLLPGFKQKELRKYQVRMTGKGGHLFGILASCVRSACCKPYVRVNTPNPRVYLIKIQIFTQFYIELSTMNQAIISVINYMYINKNYFSRNCFYRKLASVIMSTIVDLKKNDWKRQDKRQVKNHVKEKCLVKSKS